MGYTHHYEFKVTPDAGKFAETVELCEKLYNKYKGTHCELKGWDGSGEPEFTPDLLSVNGDASKGEDYESFNIDPVAGFQFCKTARMPYDFWVCLFLLAFKSQFGDDIEVTSDGNINGNDEGEMWAAAREVIADEGLDGRSTNTNSRII